MSTDDFIVKEYKLDDLKGRKIWIPHMCDAAFVMSAVIRSRGHDSAVLPRSKDTSFSLARMYTDGDQCLPSLSTLEDLLKSVDSKDVESGRSALLQGKSEGPCRFGRYYMNQSLILYKLGLDIPIFTLDNRNAYGGLGSAAKILAWDGIVGHSLLEKSLYFTRPYEVNKGEAEKLYDHYLLGICQIVGRGISGRDMVKKEKILANKHKIDLMAKLGEAANEFSKVKVDRSEKKPVVFITGEIYVRSSSVANQDLVKKIEELGGVALLEPVTSFFGYINELKYREQKEYIKCNLQSIGNFLKSSLETRIMLRDEHGISSLFHNLLGGFAHEPEPKLVMSRGSKYVNPKYKGEAIVTLGSSDYFADKVDGIINTLPFNCMPGLIVTSKANELNREKDIPFLNLSYDGYQDPNRDEQLGVFMYRVKERLKDKLVLSSKNI